MLVRCCFPQNTASVGTSPGPVCPNICQNTLDLRSRASDALELWKEDTSKEELMKKIRRSLDFLAVTRCVKDLSGATFLASLAGSVFISLVFPLILYVLTPVKLPISDFIDKNSILYIFSKFTWILSLSGSLFMLSYFFRCYFAWRIATFLEAGADVHVSVVNP